MSKKQRGKSGTGAGPQKWEAGLLAAVLEEPEWRLSLTLANGLKVKDKQHLSALAHAVNSGARRRFGIIHHDLLLEESKESAKNAKSGKLGKEAPQHIEICESVKLYLDTGDEVPVSLMARLIKFKLLHLKQLDNLRLAEDKKAGGGKDAKGKKDKPKSAKGKGGKKTPEAPGPKSGTKLMKRGEEEEKVYIDDEPDDGPQFYVVLAGFDHPYLLCQLEEIGIKVDSVITLRSEAYPPPVEVTKSETVVADSAKDEKRIAEEAEAARKLVEEEDALQRFWDDILPIMQSALPTSPLHDVARVDVVVNESVVPATLADDKDGEKKLAYGMAVYEDIACTMYDIIDLKRQHESYLSTMNLIEVTQVGDGAVGGDHHGPPLSVMPDMRYYDDLINTVPQECVSVPLVMHCMLEQVVATETGECPPSEEHPAPRDDQLDPTLASHIGDLTQGLSLSEGDKVTLDSVFPPQQKPVSAFPTQALYHAADELALRLRDLEPIRGLDPRAAEENMLHLTPLDDLFDWDSMQTRTATTLERSARLQELLYFCVNEQLSYAEVDHAFKQFVLECLNIKTPDEEGKIEGSAFLPRPSAEDEALFKQVMPWDDPYPYYKSMLPQTEADLPSDPQLEEDTEDPEPDSNGARSVTPGILKKDASSKSGRSSRGSVKFDKDDCDEGLLADSKPQKEEPSLDPGMESTVKEARRRDLTDWCFTEQFEPRVLLQVLKDASFTHPFVEPYYCKRTGAMFVVMNNPYTPEGLLNTLEWEQRTLSNMSLRNYLEHAKDLVCDWAMEQEAQYQGSLMHGDVEKQDEVDRLAAASVAKKGRGKSPAKPKKGSAKGKSPAPPTRNTEFPNSYISDGFVREGSLKAEREETLRLLKEKEEQEKAKANGKAGRQSAKSGKKTATAKDDKGKSPSRSSSKNRADKAKEDPEPIATDACDKKPDKPYWPFQGYNTGNLMLQVKGTVSTMFPSDGSIIRTEQVQFLQGKTSVKTSLVKDGNVFMVHVLEPQDLIIPEKAEDCTEREGEDADSLTITSIHKEGDSQSQPPANGSFGSFTCRLADGMSLSFSSHGAGGEPEGYYPKEPQPYIPATLRTPTPGPGATKESPTKKGKKATPEPTAVEEDMTDATDLPPEPVPVQPFQQLLLSSPDGLQTTFCLESAAGVHPEYVEERRLLVKQSYPDKTLGRQPCEVIRQHPAMEEISRVYRADGTVVKLMKDGTTEVLFADGAVSVYTGVPLNLHKDRAKEEPRELVTPRGKGKRGGKDVKSVSMEDEGLTGQTEEAHGAWTSIAADGQRIRVESDGELRQDGKALASEMTDPESGQSMLTREDHVTVVQMPDGTKIAEHKDGTRITTYFMEADFHTTAALSRRQYYRVECPGFATVSFEGSSTSCICSYGTGTLLRVDPDGQYLMEHADGFGLRVDEGGVVSYNPQYGDSKSFPEECTYTLSHDKSVILHATDRRGNKFSVTNHGQSAVAKGVLSEMVEGGVKESKSLLESRVMKYEEFAPRFFMVTPSGSGCELIRQKEVAKCLQEAEKDPTTAVITEGLSDYPDAYAITVLKPSEHTVSQKWMVPYQTATITPPGLRTRDLSNVPSVERVRPGPMFGTKIGKGMAIGSAPKVQPPAPIPKCPKTLEMRQFVQYRPVSEEVRAQLTTGLQRYADFACNRDKDTASIQVIDPRQDSEKRAAEELLKKARLLNNGDLKSVYEAVTAPPLIPPPPTAKARRTAEDIANDLMALQTEQECQTILRDQTNPAYFDSEGGRTFLDNQAKEAQYQQQRLQHQDQLLQQSQQQQLPLTNSAVPMAAGQPIISPADPYPGSLISGPFTPHPPPSVTPQYATASNTTRHTIGGASSADRPTNPTPKHATKSTLANPVRPTNPTPKRALPPIAGGGTNDGSRNGLVGGYSSSGTMPGSSNGYVSSSMSVSAPIPEHESEDEEGLQMREAERCGGGGSEGGTPGDSREVGMMMEGGTALPLQKSLQYNVVMEQRTDPVRVPGYLAHGGRSNAISNDYQTTVEEGVRRQVNTSSVAASRKLRGLGPQRLRGYEAFPERINFGILKEGITYSFPLLLKNVGIDACRYKIKQPPASTGIRAIFTPGPVAAGMKATITLEMYAMASSAENHSQAHAGGQSQTAQPPVARGEIYHELEIITEIDVLFVPIRATVLTVEEYEEKLVPSPRDGLMGMGRGAGVRVVSDKPPNDYGIVRPRKDLKVADNRSDAILSYT